MEFEWFKVSDARKSRLVHRVEEIGKALKRLGLSLPSKVVVGSKREWEEMFGEAASGAAALKKNTIYLHEDAPPDTIIHEILHVNFPDLKEGEIWRLTNMYEERLDRRGLLERI